MKSKEHLLTIRFAGICTHFRDGVVASVPHRVVLPDASKIATGLVTVTNASPNAGPVVYYLLPHFAQLEVEGQDPARLNVPPLVKGGGVVMQNGDILSGIRLQVRNAIDHEMRYLEDATPKLIEYDPLYVFSGDVVHAGRAACYFDLFGGTAFSIKVAGGATQTIVQIRTDGPPELLVSLLGASTSPPSSYVLPLTDIDGPTELTLFVKNLEAAEEQNEKIDQQGGAFDFLLHYLTARGGIPQLIRRTPGMPEGVVSATRGEIARALNTMARLLDPLENAGGRRKLVFPDEVTPSCSDSQYP
jgi:hypothetical protein